jgi:hypothetical protein
MTDNQIKQIKLAVQYLRKYRTAMEPIAETTIEKEKEKLDYDFSMTKSTVDAQICFLSEILLKH